MNASSDPLDSKTAWEPAPGSDWNLKWAAHLYRRAAFGFPPRREGVSSWQSLEEAVARGREACVEELLTGGKRAGELDELMEALGEQIAARRAGRFDDPEPEKLQGWWLYRMLHTPQPLRERMTLFWHDHFATSVAKVGSPLMMFRQNQLLRARALGPFGPLLEGVSRDPAMMVWLDASLNIKGRPNENFAREIMELFSLGVGNYSETDIREAARAFTGWGNNGPEFQFNAALHDDGEKTVLGTSGRLDGDDVVEILLKHPATARYLVRKLYREFISETHEPSNELLEPLVTAYRESDYDTTALLRRMFSSRLFYSEAAYRTRVKSPVEYVVGLVRAFDAKLSPERLARAMDGLGQTLFAPPNVAGWDGGEAWLNSATLLARHNFAAKLLGGHDSELGQAVQLADFLKSHIEGDATQRTQFLLRLLLQEDLSDEAEQRILAFTQRATQQSGSEVTAIRDAAHAILLTPEYQLA
ncbi:MAG: DUF1800 domain-containing protein [Planctomycetes bacterium]|nr:DUF1800 domain-containing protein [Planctomycetota bacterium]